MMLPSRSQVAEYVRESIRQPLFRNASALLLNTGATSALGLLYWAEAARHYGPVHVGQASALISVMLLITEISRLNLGSGLTRFVPRAGGSTMRLVLACYAIVAGLTAVVALLSLPFLRTTAAAWFTSPGLHRDLWFVGAAVTFALFSLQDSILIGLRQAVWVPFENVVFGAAKIFLLLWLAHSSQELGIFASWTIPMVGAVVVVNLFVIGRLIPRHAAATASRSENVPANAIRRFVAFDYGSALLALVATDLLPVLVATLVGAEPNAYFYMAWLVASTVDFALLSVGTSLTAEGAHDPARLPELLAGLFQRVMTLTLLGVTVLIVGASFLLGIFGASYADNAAGVLRLLALAMVPRVVVVLWAAMARVQRRMARILVAQGAQSAILLVLSIPLLHRVGIAGVGWAYLISQSIVAVAVAPQLLTLMRRAGQER
jgi:O-antigen/teichoic acid export membrane protein